MSTQPEIAGLRQLMAMWTNAELEAFFCCVRPDPSVSPPTEREELISRSVESPEGGSLVDLRRFLVDAGFRATFLKTVRDPEVVYYWERTFPILVGKPQGPILTRLDTFLRPKLIRYMVAQKENRFDLAGIMNEGKIFLAKLAQGAIGEENAYLLGTLLVSKFQQLTMSRQQTAAALRRNFYLYIDEFHNFVTPSMASIVLRSFSQSPMRESPTRMWWSRNVRGVPIVKESSQRDSLA